MLIAMTREVSPAITHCELTHLSRVEIDFGLAVEQHHQYERCLADLGCMVHRLPVAPELPDSVFIEDTAVVFGELAVIARPGADSRKPETLAVADALRAYRTLSAIEPPGTLDGGDVLRMGRTVYVGQSGRSNRAGISQLEVFLAPFEYAVRAVELTGCLHLKTAVTQVADATLLINPTWVRPDAFDGLELIEVDSAEPLAANALRIGDSVVYPAGFPRTRRRLEERGIRVRAVEVSELGKAEGGVTCCSLVFET